VPATCPTCVRPDVEGITMSGHRYATRPQLASDVPTVRIEHLVVSEAGDDVLIYDQATHQIHHLNEATAAVWRLCDGRNTAPAIAQLASMATGTVNIAIEKLAAAGLLETGPTHGAHRDARSRRMFLKSALAAGAVPAIVSVTAPSAAAAGSCQPGDAIECRANDEPCCVNAVHGICLGNGQGRFICNTA
jgi:hypothetical protein